MYGCSGVRVLLGYGTTAAVVHKHDYMQTIQRDTVCEMGFGGRVGKKEKLEKGGNNFKNNSTSDSKPRGGRKIGGFGLWTAG